MTFEELKRTLPARLAVPLPGLEGQIRMAPRPRIGWRPGHVPDDVRHSAALLLLYPVDGIAHLMLTVRDHNLVHHAGQVSLPGGAVEAEESPEQAAVREAHEEVGLDPAAVRIVGELTPLHVPVSGNVVHAKVGLAETRPHWRPDSREVARIVEVSLERLADPAILAVDRMDRFERSVEVPYFGVEGEQVWGATAMLLSEFLCVLGRPPDPWA